MLNRLKQTIKNNRALTCASYVALDRAQLLKSKLGWSASKSGNVHEDKTPEESLRYIEYVYDQYIRHWPKGVQGRAVELGPGDNCGTAILLRTYHATAVDLVDRFYTMRDQTTQTEIYRLLMERHPKIASLCKNPSAPGERDFDKVTWHTGEKAAAEVFFASRPRTYAFIASCAVFEHLYDPVKALKHMAEALVPGGAMVHAIDLRDHGMFSSAGYPELEWLTISDALWPLMTRGHGRPNRVSLEQYRQACARLGLETSFTVTHLAGSGICAQPIPEDQLTPEHLDAPIREVAKVRGRLCKSYANASDKTLAITSVLLHAVKPRTIPR
jgi:SAM-dependent methyltransferase